MVVAFVDKLAMIVVLSSWVGGSLRFFWPFGVVIIVQG